MAKQYKQAARPAAQAPRTPDPAPDAVRNLGWAAHEMAMFLKRHRGKVPAHYAESFAVKLCALQIPLVPLQVLKYRDRRLWEGWTLDTRGLMRDIEGATQLIIDTFCVTVEEHNEGRDPPDKAANGRVKRIDVQNLEQAGRDLLAIVDRNYPVQSEDTKEGNGGGTAKGKRGRGRKRTTDHDADAQFYGRWKASGLTLKDYARKKGHRYAAAKALTKRHRTRLSRDRRKSAKKRASKKTTSI